MREILVVDDDLDMRRLLGSLLSCKGYEVSLAKSYGWGILMGKLNLPDIVIADVQLGALYDGVQMAEKLQKQNPCSRIIIITAAPSDELRERAESSGFLFAEKPIRPPQILKLVQQACEELDLMEQAASST